MYEYLSADPDGQDKDEKKKRAPHPLVKRPAHFVLDQLTKLAAVLKLPSFATFLHETTFTETHAWVQTFNRLKRGDASHETADKAMEGETLEIAKVLGAKGVTRQMGLQKLIYHVLAGVCAMKPCEPQIDKVQCSARRTADGYAMQLSEWKVEEPLPEITPKLRLMLFTPDHKIEHARAGEWRERFARLYDEARERQRWEDGEPMDEDEQLDADMRAAAPATFAQPNLNAWAAPLQRRFDEWSKTERYHDAPLQLCLADLQQDEGWRRDGGQRVFERIAAIRPEDEGFSSAYVLPTVQHGGDVFALLIKERRGEMARFALVGGQRAGDESAREAAAREVWNVLGQPGAKLLDTGIKDRLATDRAVLGNVEVWAQQSRTVLFLPQLEGDGITDLVGGLEAFPVPNASSHIEGIELVRMGSLTDSLWVKANMGRVFHEHMGVLRSSMIALMLGGGPARPPPPKPPLPATRAIIAEMRELEASLTKLRLCESFHAVVQGLSSMQLADDGRRVQTVKYECGPNGGPRQALRDLVDFHGNIGDLNAVVFGATAYEITIEHGTLGLLVSLAEQVGLHESISMARDCITRHSVWTNEIARHHSVDEATAERLLDTVVRGGQYTNWFRTERISVYAQPLREILDLQKQLKEFRSNLFGHPRYKRVIEAERANLAGRGVEFGTDAHLFRHIARSCEDEVLRVVDRACFDAGFDTLRFVPDGLVVEPGIGCTTELADMLKAAEAQCEQRGWTIKLAVKPLHGLYQTTADPPPTIAEAREALHRFEARVS